MRKNSPRPSCSRLHQEGSCLPPWTSSGIGLPNSSHWPGRDLVTDFYTLLLSGRSLKVILILQPVLEVSFIRHLPFNMHPPRFWYTVSRKPCSAHAAHIRTKACWITSACGWPSNPATSVTRETGMLSQHRCRLSLKTQCVFTQTVLTSRVRQRWLGGSVS